MPDHWTQKQNALYKIVNHEYENHEDFKALSRLIELDKEIQKTVIKMKCSPLAGNEALAGNPDVLNLRINEYIDKILFGRKIFMVSVMESADLLVVVADYDFVDLVIEAMTETAEMLRYGYKIGIGSPFVLPKYMSASMREAHNAMTRQGGEKNINRYLPVADGTREYYDLYTAFNETMIRRLESAQFDEIPQAVNTFFHALRRFDPEIAFNCFINSIVWILDHFGIDRVRQFRIKYRFDLMNPSGQESLHGIRETYFDNIIAIIDLVREMRENTTKNMIGEIHEIVDREYADADLSLYSISERLNFNYCYLSKLFKKHEGIGFAEYLISVRMENAKKLLYDERHRIYEIAELVGFRSSNYFVTAFYKYSGMSTTEYRDQIKQQGG